MKVKDVMTGPVETVAPNATVRSAAERMARLNVGFLPVAQNGKPEGVLTDRDIMLRVVAAGRSPEETTVREVMTADTKTVPESSDVRDVIDLMKSKRIRRVLVQDNGTLTGVVSLGDLAVALDDKELSADALKEISRPCEPAR